MSMATAYTDMPSTLTLYVGLIGALFPAQNAEGTYSGPPSTEPTKPLANWADLEVVSGSSRHASPRVVLVSPAAHASPLVLRFASQESGIQARERVGGGVGAGVGCF